MRKNVDIVNQQPATPDGAGSAAASAPASASAAPADTLELIHAVMHRVRALHVHALRDNPHGVTRMDSRVLGFFGRHPGATLSELVLHSGRDKAQLARLVAGLRERGLLQGQADEADRRSVRLSLTAAGVAAHKALKAQGRRLAQRAVAGLDPADEAQLQRLLQRVLQNLSEPG